MSFIVHQYNKLNLNTNINILLVFIIKPSNKPLLIYIPSSYEEIFI